MQDVKSVVIFGAGALGAFYASRFLESPASTVALAASGERGVALRRNGLRVNGTSYAVEVVDPSRQQPPADLVLVALKHHQLPEALPDLRHLAGPETIFLSVMNGLDSDEMIAAACPAATVLYCMAVGIDGVRQDGEVLVANPGRLVFGEADNDQPSPAVLQVQEMLDRADLAWETPRDMLRALWWKFMINVGVNQASAVLRASYGVFQQSADASAVVETLMREVLLLAGHVGIDLRESDLEAWDGVLQKLSPVGKTSMLQDIEAGRRTEVEMFAGKVLALAEKHGVDTPANRLMLRCIRTLETMSAPS